MSLEETLALVVEQNATILAELRELRSERRHEGGRWSTRAEAARHLEISVDTVDARIADGTLRAEKIGPPPADRRDRLGRRIDRRPTRVWLSGPPKTEAEIETMAREARA